MSNTDAFASVFENEYKSFLSTSEFQKVVAPLATEIPHDEIESPDANDLQDALPTLTQKLRELQKQLSPDEQAVFSSIVNSAATHLQAMEAVEITAKVRYFKPIQAAATPAVRTNIIQLPRTLGLDK